MTTTKTTTNINDIINWFNHKRMEDTNSHIPFSQTKMMQILYMLQGIDLVVYNHPAFKDDILNIHIKPYIPAVVEYYAKPKSKQGYKNVDKNKKLKQLVNAEYRQINYLTKLDFMHKLHVFNEHTEHLVIPKYFIKYYFSKYILEL